MQRLVTNNLNDTAKDHPAVVAALADKWMKGASKERTKLLRYVCRTLIKQGNKKALRVFGYKAPNV